METWSGSIEIGVIALDPENIELPASATALCEGSWILSGCTVLRNSESILDEYGCDLDACAIGDRIGVQRTRIGELRIYLNGVDQGVAAVNLPKKVYAVVDLYGKCTKVTVVTSQRGETGKLVCHHSSVDSQKGIITIQRCLIFIFLGGGGQGRGGG